MTLLNDFEYVVTLTPKGGSCRKLTFKMDTRYGYPYVSLLSGISDLLGRPLLYYIRYASARVVPICRTSFAFSRSGNTSDSNFATAVVSVMNPNTTIVCHGTHYAVSVEPVASEMDVLSNCSDKDEAPLPQGKGRIRTEF